MPDFDFLKRRLIDAILRPERERLDHNRSAQLHSAIQNLCTRMHKHELHQLGMLAARLLLERAATDIMHERAQLIESNSDARVNWKFGAGLVSEVDDLLLKIKADAPDYHQALINTLANGSFLKLEAGIGLNGLIDARFVVVGPRGETVEMANVEFSHV